MPHDPKAHRFRVEVDRRGIGLGVALGEDRFVFHLHEGVIEISPHPVLALILAGIAAETYGLYRGEHRELLLLVAERDLLDAPVHDEAGVHWRPAELTGANLNPWKWVRFHAWLYDQFAHLCILPAA